MVRIKETNANAGEFEFKLVRRKGSKESLNTHQNCMIGILPFHRRQYTKIRAVCIDEAVLIGFCEIRPIYHTIRIMVETPFRYRGVGKRLLHMVCEEAKCQTKHFIFAIINPENYISISFHANAGFEPIGTIHLCFPYRQGIAQKPRRRAVMGIALDAYGLAVVKICRQALRLVVPFSRVTNLIAMTILRSDSEACARDLM